MSLACFWTYCPMRASWSALAADALLFRADEPCPLIGGEVIDRVARVARGAVHVHELFGVRPQELDIADELLSGRIGFERDLRPLLARGRVGLRGAASQQSFLVVFHLRDGNATAGGEEHQAATAALLPAANLDLEIASFDREHLGAGRRIERPHGGPAGADAERERGDRIDGRDGVGEMSGRIGDRLCRIGRCGMGCRGHQREKSC